MISWVGFLNDLFTISYTNDLPILSEKIPMKVHSFSLFEYIIEEIYIKEEIQNFHYTPLNKYFSSFMCFFS